MSYSDPPPEAPTQTQAPHLYKMRGRIPLLNGALLVMLIYLSFPFFGAFFPFFYFPFAFLFSLFSVLFWRPLVTLWGRGPQPPPPYAPVMSDIGCAKVFSD